MDVFGNRITAVVQQDGRKWITPAAIVHVEGSMHWMKNHNISHMLAACRTYLFIAMLAHHVAQ